MARPKTLTPKYRLHKPSCQAVVRINGRDFYLGKHGSAESKERYAALMADYLTVGRVAEPEPLGDLGPTVDAMLAAYWLHIEENGRYLKNGEPTSERSWLQDSLRPLSALFGESLAGEFGPKKLHALRAWIIDASRERGRSLSRSTLNARIRRVVRVFRWATSMELVPPSVWYGLQSVPGLRRGESNRVNESAGVKAVAWSDVEAVVAKVNHVVEAMIRLQWLTGMRPGEVVSIRGMDIDRSGELWVYRPARHKTEHHDRVCERLLGPRAQAMLRPFLKDDLQAFLFSPKDGQNERHKKRRDARETPLWPSHERRYLDDPVAQAGESYNTHSYRRAVKYGCKKAGVEAWSPNQLRHSRATEVRRLYGLEAAQVTLGHTSADITQVYAERDLQLARRVALETG